MSRPEGLPPDARPIRQPQGYTFWIVGDKRRVARDAYHRFLRMPWGISIALIAAWFLVVNLLFALVYVGVGGVDGMRSGSYWDALVFSVETLGTIGYGVMAPKSAAANGVMIVESMSSIIFTALATGLLFTKFARATARVAFTSHAVITKHEGTPTLMFRVGNLRSNTIVDATLRVTASFTRTTAEGEMFYKLINLPLVRDRMSGMRRGWVAMHTIDEASPFHGLTAEDLKKQEVELEIALMGLDDVTMQTVYSLHTYTDAQIKFGCRFADTMRPLSNGDMVLDLTKFDVLVPDTVARDSVPA